MQGDRQYSHVCKWGKGRGWPGKNESAGRRGRAKTKITSATFWRRSFRSVSSCGAQMCTRARVHPYTSIRMDTHTHIHTCTRAWTHVHVKSTEFSLGTGNTELEPVLVPAIIEFKLVSVSANSFLVSVRAALAAPKCHKSGQHSHARTSIHSTSPRAPIWYDMTWYDMTWYDMIWYDMIWYGMVWYGMIWYDRIWYDVICYELRWLMWYGMR